MHKCCIAPFASFSVHVQELGKQNPELLTLINQHQQEFLRIINEPVPPEQAEQVSQQIAQFQAGMGGGAGGEQGGSPPRDWCHARKSMARQKGSFCCVTYELPPNQPGLHTLTHALLCAREVVKPHRNCEIARGLWY